MLCFKLPLSLIKQLQSILTRFWWDLSPEVRKMCWVSWSNLSKPKSNGGLGFRELAQFNDALLAKISWRILKNPNSLLARILLGKYCLRSSFLQTTATKGCSHGWRGILVGRDLLTKGLGWALGSGSEVSIWTDPWLSTAEPVIPIGPPTQDTQTWKVNRLIDPVTKDWNVTLIKEIMPQYEEEIRKLIPSSFPSQDERVWLPNTSGVYSTKSGYAVAKLCFGDDPIPNFDWKKCVWQVDTSPKLKHFLWKSNSKALPVGSQLVSRGLPLAPTCRRCGGFETELHVLFQCPFAAKVWDMVPSLNKPELESITSVAQLLQQCRRMISLPPTGLGSTPLYPWVLWVLWINRNKLLFEDKSFTEENSVLKAIQDARAWKAAQTYVEKPSLPHSVVPLDVGPISSVNTYTWVCFSDAAWDSSSGNCGLGWQLRDSLDVCAEQSSSHRRYVPSVLVAEALAVKAAITAALSSHVRSLRVYSDSKSLVMLLKSHRQNVSLKGVLHDIYVLTRSFDVISFHYVSRLANCTADSLAK